MNMNEREKKAWRKVYDEKTETFFKDFELINGRSALVELAIMWAEHDEEWIRANKPDCLILKLLDERRARNVREAQ